ncbi:hypothetical protein Lalb_Chr21g0319361 [Lupinus albus]|uniref:Uncharacterized protein n=1 Tax=Lupinus albus TaxID=3870 RepID=A0A6A4NV63_LUPAL|nr:hypothetical protein Lalb_Chr21g0319361 [Lupinus albus]
MKSSKRRKNNNESRSLSSIVSYPFCFLHPRQLCIQKSWHAHLRSLTRARKLSLFWPQPDFGHRKALTFTHTSNLLCFFHIPLH